MKQILIHGLGQNETSWDKVKEEFIKNDIYVETPNIFDLVKKYEINYENVYKSFAEYCHAFHEKLDLCGLSLGGILSLQYAVEFPEKVNSIVIIGTPYEISKRLFKLQNIIFQFMPQKTFENMGVPKKDFINLVNSMAELDIKSNVEKIQCNTLILCGEKDSSNMESAKQLHKHIKNSQLDIIKNAGHEVNMDNPIALSNRITEYWKMKDVK